MKGWDVSLIPTEDLAKAKNWERDRGDEEKRAGYRKMTAMVSTTYGLISAVEFPENQMAHDSPSLSPPLLGNYQQLFVDTPRVFG